MAGSEGFEKLEPIFGEAEPEVERQQQEPIADGFELHPFLFYVHALDSSRIEILASDFRSLTFARTLTVHQLDDLRDDIGIGGSWSEFVDYLIASLSSGKVKLSIESVATVTVDSGKIHAKLIAHKSKGLPRISILLNKLFNSSADDATAKFSHALFKAFQEKQNATGVEHEHLLKVKGLLSSEKERNESLQRQLDGLSFNNKRKMHKSKAPEKASLLSESSTEEKITLVSKTLPVSGVSETKPPPGAFQTERPSERPIGTATQPMKVSQRAAPTSRRARTRGISLQDSGDGDN